MIEIRYLQAESGANKFGTCNCCGKSSGEDSLMISIKFSYYGHGTLICLCDDCKKKLIEALPPVNNSEIPNSYDTISRAKAIETLTKDKKALEHIINRMSGYEKEFDRFVGQRNQVDYDIYAIEQLPPAQPEIIRCKDCKHFKQVFAPNDNDGLCGHWHSKCDARTSQNGYCSHAERKEVTE